MLPIVNVSLDTVYASNEYIFEFHPSFPEVFTILEESINSMLFELFKIFDTRVNVPFPD
jgi:hypothetical protein